MMLSARAPMAANSGDPAGKRQTVRAPHGEALAGNMEAAERLSEQLAHCSIEARRTETPSRKVMSAAGLPASSRSVRPSPVVHRQRTRDAARGEMLHQRQEIREVLRRARASRKA